MARSAIVWVAVGLSADCANDRPRETAAPVSQAQSDWFVDAAEGAGLHFVHVNGMRGQRHLAEIMGAGVAVFDYDNDGDLDVYAVQGGPLDVPVSPSGADDPSAGPMVAPRASRGQADTVPASGDRLFRNDLDRGPSGMTLRFTDVTAAAGIDVRSYGMGVAAGDVDNDGWVDLYLTRLGPDVLLRNNGDGTFSDVTRAAGINDSAWSVPASFFDFDRDGWLDLYVGNYVRYDLRKRMECRGPTGATDYCTPQVYPSMAGHLYRNRGNGSFVDVTVASGLASAYGPALGSSAADFDGDGWVDLYVANDGTANQLWMNRRNGTFTDRALVAGVAVSADGRPEGSMGVDAADFDNDGDQDLVVTNLFAEGTVLYVNDGTGSFEDRGAASGLRPASLRYTGFGVAWVDVDNDSSLDVLTVNGAVQMAQPFARPGDSFPLDQPLQLLRGIGAGRFKDVTSEAGVALTSAEVGRGAAFGDIDNDGDTDVVVANNNGPLRLLVNTVGNRRPWIGLRLIGRDGRRDAIGARVAVTTGTGATLWRRVKSDGSYASANDPRLLVGLGDAARPPRIRIEWPDGASEDRIIDAIGRWTTVHQEKGR